MYPCDLNRRHEVHIELDLHVDGALEEHDPLFSMLNVQILSEKLQEEENQVEKDRNRDGNEDWSKDHSLLEYEVRNQGNHNESDEGALRVADKRPLYRVISYVNRVHQLYINA